MLWVCAYQDKKAYDKQGLEKKNKLRWWSKSLHIYRSVVQTKNVSKDFLYWLQVHVTLHNQKYVILIGIHTV